MILNDFKLQVNEETGKYDLAIDKYDLVNITGLKTVENAVIMALLTQYNELSYYLPNYEDFGSRLYEIVKTNKNNMTKHIIEDNIITALENVDIISEIEDVEVIENGTAYNVRLSLISVNDELLTYNFDLEV